MKLQRMGLIRWSRREDFPSDDTDESREFQMRLTRKLTDLLNEAYVRGFNVFVDASKGEILDTEEMDQA